MAEHDPMRCNLLRGVAAAATFASVTSAAAQTCSDTGLREPNGQPVPEPADERSAGQIRSGRGTVLTEKIAVVTGAARGIGRAIAVELAGAEKQLTRAAEDNRDTKGPCAGRSSSGCTV